MKEEMSTIIHPFYDYLMGRTQNLNVVISTEPAREILRENLWEAFSASPPPELKGFPQAVKEQYFDELYQQLAQDIPSTIEFTEDSLPPEALAILEQIRQALSYFSLAYQGLIGFMALLVLGIILVSRDVKDITRRLGVPFLTYGAVEYGGIFAARYFAEKPLPIPGLPPALETWMPQFLYNLMAPLEIFSLGLLIGGIVLIVVSIIYKRGQSVAED